jgi:hypothetical protein
MKYREKFKEFWIEYTSENLKSYAYKDVADDSWEACKKEVLKILKDNLKPYSDTSFSRDFKINVIEKEKSKTGLRMSGTSRNREFYYRLFKE